MSKIFSYICYPFYCCCPCLRSGSKSKTKKRTKEGKLVVQTPNLDSEGWEHKSKLLSSTPDQIDDKNLTKEYQIPEDYKTVEECLRARGLEPLEKINSGNNADVYKMANKEDNTVMACKVIRTGQLVRDKVMFSRLKSELFIMIRAKRHENIVQVIRHFIIRNNISKSESCYLCMEWANGGTVVTQMARTEPNSVAIPKRLTERTAKEYFRQISNGLEFLHLNGIAHKDLKLDNVLVFQSNDKKECLKITDFGLSRIGYNDKKGIVVKEDSGEGSLEYMSPQILKLHIYRIFGVKVAKLKVFDPFIADCWALGVCLYAMVFAKFPFNYDKNGDEESLQQMYDCMQQKKFEITDNFRYNYSKECLDLIRQLLEPNVNKRLTVRLVLSHKWLKDIDNK